MKAAHGSGGWAGRIAAAAVLLFPGAARCAEEAVAEGAAVVIERSPTDWLLLLVGLGVFWILTAGLFTVLVMKVKEADRLFNLLR